jgi:probable rRNA maturation factor
MTPSRRRDARGPAVDVVIQSRRWHRIPHAAKLVRRVLTAATPARVGNAELSVILTNDRAMSAINLKWRGRDAPTNVLSFPTPARKRGAPRHLGDIVIAYETTAREAREAKTPFDHHLAHLTVHGFLHLLGYDHELDPEAEAMERRERRILARLGVPDPYAAHGADA